MASSAARRVDETIKSLTLEKPDVRAARSIRAFASELNRSVNRASFMCQMYVILMSFKNVKICQVGLTSRY